MDSRARVAARKRSRWPLFQGLLVLLLTSACSGALLRQEDLRQFNTEYSDKVLRVQENLFATYSDPDSNAREVLFKQGAEIRIWAESEGDWIKVRAIPAKESLEYNPGTTILFILRDIMEQEGEPEDEIEEYPLDKLKQKVARLAK